MPETCVILKVYRFVFDLDRNVVIAPTAGRERLSVYYRNVVLLLMCFIVNHSICSTIAVKWESDVIPRLRMGSASCPSAFLTAKFLFKVIRRKNLSARLFSLWWSLCSTSAKLHNPLAGPVTYPQV